MRWECVIWYNGIIATRVDYKADSLVIGCSYYISCTKYDLARLCFQLLPIIGDEKFLEFRQMEWIEMKNLNKFVTRYISRYIIFKVFKGDIITLSHIPERRYDIDVPLIHMVHSLWLLSPQIFYPHQNHTWNHVRYASISCHTIN